MKENPHNVTIPEADFDLKLSVVALFVLGEPDVKLDDDRRLGAALAEGHLSILSDPSLGRTGDRLLLH